MLREVTRASNMRFHESRFMRGERAHRQCMAGQQPSRAVEGKVAGCLLCCVSLERGAPPRHAAGACHYSATRGSRTSRRGSHFRRQHSSEPKSLLPWPGPKLVLIWRGGERRKESSGRDPWFFSAIHVAQNLLNMHSPFLESRKTEK